MVEHVEFDGGSSRASNADLKAMVAARLGVKGDFIRVPQLAKALGISTASIHAQMRSGRFPISHRRVGNIILVKLDDYVRWFINEAMDAGSRKASPSPEIKAPDCEEPPRETATPEILTSQRKETRAEFKARLNREVLADMRSKGFDV